MIKQPILRLLATIAALVAITLLARIPRHAPASAPVSGAVAATPAAEAATAGGHAAVLGHPEIGFVNREHLNEHWHKHGAEMGATSPEDYLRRAQELRDLPVGGPVLEAKRADGVITRFDRDDGAFLAFHDDLTILTFFHPHDGERYFQRQLEREHSR